MASIRLNQQTRKMLRDHAAKLVVCPVELAAEEAAKAALVDCALGAIRKRFPERDMRVLLKYEAAVWSGSPHFSLEDNAWSASSVAVDVTEPVLLPMRHGGSRVVVLGRDHDFWLLNADFGRARDAHTRAREAILQNYRTLIHDSNTLEAVVQVWPEAEQLREKIGGPIQPPMRLSASVIDAVKADVARRNEQPAGLQLVEGAAS